MANILFWSQTSRVAVLALVLRNHGLSGTDRHVLHQPVNVYFNHVGLTSSVAHMFMCTRSKSCVSTVPHLKIVF